MEQIVLVDDEPMMLRAISRLLMRIPCAFDGQVYPLNVVSFTDPYAALAYIEAHAVSLILSDYRMPEMDGVTLLSRCLALQPEVPRLIISGYADLNALIGAINQAQIYRFIAKPWSDYELVTTVAQALRYRQLWLENKKLADMCRLKMSHSSPQERERRRLEQEEPGITNVNWGADGSLLLDEDQ
jgi:two-component system, probable response regulator PhcQ